MLFTGFEPADFDLFAIDGFVPRMEALKTQLRPKLEAIGEDLKPDLIQLTGDEIFAHVAKHARRTTNPPNDTWVAFGPEKRGYKMGPHFQVCVWGTHVLIQWGLIYEARNKATFATRLRRNRATIRKTIPADFQWSKDHTRPEGLQQRDMKTSDFEDIANRLLHNKNGEVMVGKVVPRDIAITLTAADFHGLAVDVFRQLVALHRMCY